MFIEKRSIKLVSGGQTGADRAALDFAIENGIEYGGWIPKGRLAEDGPISSAYNALRESHSPDYAERTRRNIEDSDGTLIISHGELRGGSLLTRQIASDTNAKFLHIDLQEADRQTAAAATRTWIREHGIGVLNVAGSRESGDPLIYNATRDLLTLIFV